MALPKRLRDQMRQEGTTLEDIAVEVNEKTGKFGLNEEIANGDYLDVPDADELPSSDDYADDLADQQRPAATTRPTDGDDTQTGGDGTDTVTGGTGDDTADAGDAPDARPVDATAYINPFDVDFEDDEPAPVAQQPAPETERQTRPAAPAPAPVAQQPAATNFQFTEDEIRALGGSAQAQIMQGILARFVQPEQEQMRADLRNSQLTLFRQGVVAQVPQYREIISSRSWKKYLESYSPLAGSTVKDALLSADARLDQRAVLGIFEDFRAKHAPKDAQAENKRDAKNNRPKPADLATPGKSATSNGGVKPGKRFKYKESDISKFDDQRRRKKIDAITYQDRVADYEKALAEGNVELGA